MSAQPPIGVVTIDDPLHFGSYLYKANKAIHHVTGAALRLGQDAPVECNTLKSASRCLVRRIELGGLHRL